MAPKASTCIVLLYIMAFCTTTITAFNITILLDNHPDFSTFNNILTQTGVAAGINSRRTITVLVVSNSDMGSISSKPQEVMKKIIMTHVLLDYYDTTNLKDLSKNGSTVTNFFQTTGLAYKGQGTTNVTTSGGEVIFSSAMDGAPKNSKMVQSIASQSYNISVIQISQPIVTPGIEQTTPNGPPSNNTSPPPPTPMAAPPKKANQTEAKAPEGPQEDDEEADSEAPAPGGDDADKEVADKKTPPPHKSSGAQMTASGAIVWALGLLALSL